uniref:Uncharacterized protein n=1 Tax=Panagrellus redivivus TaxID=6233 RepID=A0A7E4VEC7_PANRE
MSHFKSTSNNPAGPEHTGLYGQTRLFIRLSPGPIYMLCIEPHRLRVVFILASQSSEARSTSMIRPSGATIHPFGLCLLQFFD